MVVDALRGLRLVEGSRRLIGLHWLLAILAALPGWSLGRAALTDAVGRRPYFTDAPAPLPLPQLVGLLREVPNAMWGALAAGLVVAWLGRLMLTAAAVVILDPGPAFGPVHVWRTVFDRGIRYVLPYLRVAVVSGLFLVTGATLIAGAFNLVLEHGETAGWTAKTLYITLPCGTGLAVLAWAAGVGVYAFWSRVVLVADRRRSVVGLIPVVWDLSLRRPMVFMVFHWIVSIASVALGAAVLVAWRQSSSGAALWFASWLGVLLLQAFLWHWRLRVCRLVWARTSWPPGPDTF